MQIDAKSFILGAIVGGCIVVFRAAVAVAKDKLKKDENSKEEA